MGGRTRDERPLRDGWDRIRPLLAADVARRGRGVALLIVMVMVAVLAAFSAEFSYNTRVNLRMASNLERDVQAYYHARSAIEVARMVIRGQAMLNQVLSLMAAGGGGAQNIELWSYACKFAEIYNTGKVDLFGKEMFDLSGQAGIGVKNGSFTCTADAEDGRVNVNFGETVEAKKAMFAELFGFLRGPRIEGHGLTDDDEEIIDTLLNIMDWVDPDEVRTDFNPLDGSFQEGGGSGEDFDYSKYDYGAKNAKFDSVEELRLVEGMDDEMFCKLRDKVTVYSTEKLNVNTADMGLINAVLCQSLPTDQQLTMCLPNAALGGITPMDAVGAVVDQCREIKKMLMMTPFNNTQKFQQVVNGVSAYLQAPIQVPATALQHFGTKSRVIRISASGTVGHTTKTLTGVIDTGSGKYVYWRED
ncbi:MAG: hypothetical protein AMXMBFR64_29580 [Myxococcales bacterium]